MKPYYSPLKEHPGDYGDNPRSELLEFIEKAPKKVLEIGCGRGAFGELVKKKYPSTHYIGVESDKSAVTVADTRLDRVVLCDIEKVELAQLTGPAT